MPVLSQTTIAVIAAIAFVGGWLLSPLLARLILWFAEDRPPGRSIGCTACDRTTTWHSLLRRVPCECGTRRPRWPLLLSAGTSTLFAAFAVLYFGFLSQETADVRPTAFWFYARFGYHLFLFTTLIVLTGTDLWNYTIADLPVIVGAAFGIALATLSGDLQTVHIWVDWNQEIPGFRGPYRPDWLSTHPHLHGLAWSVTGAVAGAGITWLLRMTAEVLLQKPALGLGDVTLMAMVGSYTGWQPVTIILLLAPLLAIVIGISVRLISGRSFVAYGPYLALASVIVLCSWRWIWMTDLRLIFGHVPSLATLAGTAAGALVIMLGALRLYQAIPTGIDRPEA